MKASMKTLWIISIILLGLTAAITLVSGIGTYCVAWNAEQYEEFAALVEYKTLYKAFVILTVAVAVLLVAGISLLVFPRLQSRLADSRFLSRLRLTA